MRGGVVLLACLVAGAATGCGGSSEEDEARDVVKEYMSAVADGDEGKVCDTLARHARRQFERSKSTCEKAYKNFGRVLEREQRDRLKELDPEVKVTGSNATTKVDEPPFQGELRLKKEGGEWKISSQ